MRYFSTGEVLVIASEVTGIDGLTLLRVELLESSLHAPQAGFGDVEFYSEFVDKAPSLSYALLAIVHSRTGTRGWPGLR